MKKKHLRELIHHITREVLKEFTSMSSVSNTNTSSTSLKDPTQDPNAPPVDAMTSMEKAKLERDQEHVRQAQIKQKNVELDARKKEMDFNKRKLDQQKRFDIPNMTKELQKLKGAHL